MGGCVLMGRMEVLGGKGEGGEHGWMCFDGWGGGVGREGGGEGVSVGGCVLMGRVEVLDGKGEGGRVSMGGCVLMGRVEVLDGKGGGEGGERRWMCFNLKGRGVGWEGGGCEHGWDLL